MEAKVTTKVMICEVDDEECGLDHPTLREAELNALRIEAMQTRGFTVDPTLRAVARAGQIELVETGEFRVERAA